ncbi:hypothetical protein ENH_00029420, partial [Eimeria necatrix]
EAESLYLRSPFLPSPLRPSDHISLFARFKWLGD